MTLSAANGGPIPAEPVEARHIAWLGVILLAAAGFRFVFSPSIAGSDDLSVAQCALALMDDGFSVPQGHYCARFALIVPMAAIFAIAGTGAAQLSLLPALTSLAGILLAWRLGSLMFGPAAGLVAAAAMALFPMDIEFAGLAFPDALQGVLLAAAMLALLRARDRGVSCALAAGVLWALAYYVKVDAALLAPVIGFAWLLGHVRFGHALIAGIMALLLVGVELGAYGVLTGNPFLRLKLESIAANEVLAPGLDYRSFLIYPKAMFLVPYQAGLHYFLWLAALVAAALLQTRAALLFAGWSVFWMLWLVLGADPFSGFRMKPQLPRYLLSFAVPMTVLVGWLFVLVWQRTRVVALAAAAAATAAALVFAPFNRLTHEPAEATRIALATAVREGWFPLCPDTQSMGTARVLLHGREQAATLCVVQRHDFLAGVTTFHRPPAPSYLLVNEAYARRLERRNLVRPIDPDGFGLLAREIWRVDNPLPATSYAALGLLRRASALMPVTSLRESIAATSAEVMRGADARIWRLEPIP